MRSLQKDHRHLLRIDRGEKINETIIEYLQSKGITAGKISGIGAAADLTLGFYDVHTKEYYSKLFEGDYEITSLLGNVSIKDGGPWAHLHITISDKDCRAYGGHLESGTVAVTCEVIIEEVDAAIERAFDEKTGLQLWQLAVGN